jgi:dolichol-phosphate mannosyltransferase
MSSRICFILPAFNEGESIYPLILKMYAVVPKNSVIVVVDDSPDNNTVSNCHRAFEDSGWEKDNWEILRSPKKSGRGDAVRRGFIHTRKDPTIDCFVEMDSDGSHSPEMAMKVASRIPMVDFCIGSRYMANSQIIGWSIERRLFSKLINFLLRRIFGRKISDWTNGLRAYSPKAVEVITSRDPHTRGFIYLSEQAVILSNEKYKFDQVPIVFQERIAGESSVTWREISQSIIGVYRIYRSRHSLRT